MTTTALSASSLSARLHRMGFRPSASATREGLHVSRTVTRGEVRVTCDLDSDRHARELADLVTEHLTAAGYAVRAGRSGTILYVTREG